MNNIIYESFKKYNPKLRLILFSFTLVALLYLIVLLTDIGNYNNIYISSEIKHHEPAKAKTIKFSSIEHSAYVYLALGAQANQLNCEASIESLVKYGGWDGHIYIITDRNNCYVKEKIASNAGMDKSKLHILMTKEHFDGGFDLKHSEMGARINRFKSFTMKTRLFDFITDPKIEVLAYVDCDILFGIEGCAKEFITTGPSWFENQIRFTRVTKKNGTLDDVHCGSLVVHREHSKDLLQLWRNELDKLTSEGDNDAFNLLYKQIEMKIKESNITNMTSFNSTHTTVNNITRHIYKDEIFLNKVLHERSLNKIYINKNPLEPIQIIDKSNERFEVFLNTDRISKAVCMTHISKATCNRMGRIVIQEYVNKFNLNTYENKYKYCTSLLLQPLLYGWFPLSYIPFCPKLEKML